MVDRPVPVNTELRKYLCESFLLLPFRAIYLPELGMIETERGSVKVPKEFQRYPILAMFFVKYRLKKQPLSLWKDPIRWPEPYVVLNTILKRLQCHKYASHERLLEISAKIQILIAPDIEIPKFKENEALQLPRKFRPTIKNLDKRFTDPGVTKSDIAKFFNGIKDYTMLQDVNGSKFNVIVRISCKNIFQETPIHLRELAQDIRAVWVSDIVFGSLNTQI